MDVKFISTTSNRLSELPIVGGQLIYLSDMNATFYDIGGSRYLIGSFQLLSTLPDAGQPGVIYGIVNSAGRVDASVWDPDISGYRMLSGYKATTTSLGLVQPDGTSITIDANGVITAVAASSLPAASITYDDETSHLGATNVQRALDLITAMATSAVNAAAAAAASAAAASTAVAGYESRLSAVENVANVALVTE